MNALIALDVIPSELTLNESDARIEDTKVVRLYSNREENRDDRVSATERHSSETRDHTPAHRHC